MFLSIIQNRRSIRNFLDKPVEEEKIDQLLRAALWAPSSRSFRPWEFIVVKNKKVLEALSRAKHGAGFLKKAFLGIAVLADPEKSDVWIEDASIVSANLLYAAHDLGLGACWAQIRNRWFSEKVTAEEYVQGVLDIPKNYKVESVIGIGYPAEEMAPYTDEMLDYSKVHYEGFGKKWES